MQIDEVIYREGETNIQTFIVGDSCAYTDKTVEEYLNEGFVRISFDEAMEKIREAQEKKYIAPFREVDEEEFDRALNCLPPQKWQKVDEYEIFRMCEYMTDNITSHYVKTPAGRFFVALRRTTTDYRAIIEEVKAL